MQQGSGLGEPLMISSESDPDLEHALAARPVEVGEVQDVRLEFVPSPRLGGVPGSFGSRQVQPFAAGGGIPEVPDGIFFGRTRL